MLAERDDRRAVDGLIPNEPRELSVGGGAAGAPLGGEQLDEHGRPPGPHDGCGLRGEARTDGDGRADGEEESDEGLHTLPNAVRRLSVP